jgi:hypothetical protein
MQASKPTIHFEESLAAFTLFFFSFEWVIWVLLPIPFLWVSNLRILVDAGLFFTTLTLLARRRGYRGLRKGRILASLLVITGCALAPVIRFHSNLFLSLQSIFVIIRYFPLAMLDYSRFGEHFRKTAKAVLAIHITIGLAQLVRVFNSSALFQNAFSRFDELGRVGLPTAMREDQSGIGISGIFLNTIDLAILVVMLYFFLYWGKEIRRKGIATLTSLVVVAGTRSFSATAFLLILVLIDIRSKGRRRLAISAAVIGVATVASLRFEALVFTLGNSLEYNRLGFILNLLPRFIVDNPLNAFIGLGSDHLIAFNQVMNYANLPQMLIDEGSLANLRDVFWVALIVQWGLIGFGAVVILLHEIVARVNSRHMVSLLVLTAAWGMVNQVLEIKIYAFLFYLLIGMYRQRESNACR